jgi:hypothetical protein
MRIKKEVDCRVIGEVGGWLCKDHEEGPRFLPVSKFKEYKSGDGRSYRKTRCHECHKEWLRQYHNKQRLGAELAAQVRLNRLWKAPKHAEVA